MEQGAGQETRVLTVVKWIFIALGAASLAVFLLEPDIHAHPQLVLMAGMGLTGSLILHALSGILGPTPK